MKASAEKSSSTTSKTATQTANQPFFAKAGGGDFFSAIQQSRLVIQDGKRMFRTGTGQLVELPSDISIEEAVKLETEAKVAEQKLGKRPPPKPVPDVKKLVKIEVKKSTPKAGKGKQSAAGKGKTVSKAGAAVAGLKAVGASKVAQYLANKGTPALLKGIGMLQQLKQNEQTHDDAGEKLNQTEKAVVIPPSEGQSKSNAGQVNTVSDRPPPVADENKGKQKLQISLRENVPKSIEDVDNFKSDQKAQHMGADVMSVVQVDKGAVVSAFNEMEQTPPPLPPEHTPENLPPEEIAPPTAVMNLGQGAIAPLQKEHTDVSNFTNEADGKLKQEGVTQEQLDMVDSGDLAEANKEKKGMETKAKTEPVAVNNFVQQSASKIDVDLKQEEKKERDGMKAKRKADLGATTQKQKGAKSALEKKREEVASKINGIYTKAQNSVKKKLADLETLSMKRFDDGNSKATKEFEDNVKGEIDAFKADRYSGWFGRARRAKDWLLGMDDLPEVKAIFDRNRAVFVSTINKLVEDITADNKRVIQECKDELATAKQEIKDYVDKLGPDLKDIGRKSADEMNAKLAEMDHFIAKKEQELQDKLKDKQQAAIKAIDEKIEKMKEAMAGALAKLGKLLLLAAKKFFTWALEKAGFSLSNIESIISKGAAVLKAIFTKPIVFVKNLVNAAINGFKNFGKNFLKHLKDALFEWLTGSLEGLVLPQTWDFKGIISVALQMIGISYQNIRKHLVDVIGEPAVANLEKTFTLVKTLITEGPIAAWEQLKEMAGEMKEAFLDAVKDFVKTKVIEQAIQWVVSIFVPGAGIVKAVIGIYDTIMFFIQKAKQIMQMIGNFLSSIGDIAAGNIGAAADALENGLARGLSLVISFLAQLLHLSGITKKIKDAIQKIRNKVDAVLAKVAKWIADKAKKLFGAIKAGVAKLLEWLGIKKIFDGNDGKEHKLYFGGGETNPILMVKSNPQAYGKFIENIQVDQNDTKRSDAKKLALSITQDIDKKRIEPLKGPTEEAKEKSKEEKLIAVGKLLDKLAVPTKVLFGDISAAGEPEIKNTTQAAGHGITMTALKLNKNQKIKGSPPKGTMTASYEILNRRRDEGNPASSYYVKGHLLNENLGGKGEWINLTPLSRKGNSDHESQVESLVKAAFNSGAVVEYNVTAVYGYGQNESAIPSDDPNVSEKKKIIKEEVNVPTTLVCEAFVMEKQGDSFVRKQSIVKASANNPIGQNAASYALSDSLVRETIYLNDSDAGKIAKVIDAEIAKKIVQAHKLNGKSRFNTYVELINARKNKAIELIFTRSEQDKLKKLSESNYVKLYKGAGGEKSTGTASDISIF